MDAKLAPITRRVKSNVKPYAHLTEYSCPTGQHAAPNKLVQHLSIGCDRLSQYRLNTPCLTIIRGSMGIFYPTSQAAGSRYSFTGTASGSSFSVLAVAAVHGVILALLLFVVPAGRVVEFVRPLAVRLIELAPAVPPPPPAPPKIQPRLKPPPVQPRILAVTPMPNAPEAPAAFVVPAPPPAPAVPPAPNFVPTPPAPITAARFDADYLQNPSPIYPALSRRLSEEGKVVLRVHVNTTGQATEVAIRTPSGYARLDNAARDAVQQWRFVPARRGDSPIDAWVLVPIVFKLEG